MVNVPSTNRVRLIISTKSEVGRGVFPNFSKSVTRSRRTDDGSAEDHEHIEHEHRPSKQAVAALRFGQGGIHNPQATGPPLSSPSEAWSITSRSGRYDEPMKKPLLTLIIVAILVAVGFKIYKAMTVEVPVEDQG